MGTRSLTHIIDGEVNFKKTKPSNKTLLTLYRQYDGYLTGHGLDLAEFLQDISIVNGISEDTERKANGMGCLSAQLIAHLKDGVGNIYVYPPDSKDCWEEFTYYIYNEKIGEGVKIAVEGTDNEILFNGTPGEFINKLNK